MSIDALVKIVPPPAAPCAAFTGPWAPVEKLLRTPLPEDYKAFVARFGLGFFMDFLRVRVPRTRILGARLESEVYALTDLFRYIYAEHPHDLPFPLWPEREGLLPFADSFNGDVFFWLMRGEPAEWPVVMWDRHEFESPFEVFDCGFAEFLRRMAVGEIDLELLPCETPFEPASEPPLSDAWFGVSWRLGPFGTGSSGASKIRLR